MTKVSKKAFLKNSYLYNCIGDEKLCKKQRKDILGSMTNAQLKDVIDMLKKVLLTRYPLKPKQHKILRRNRKFIYAIISDLVKPPVKKKKICKQEGGAVFPVIVQLIKALI